MIRRAFKWVAKAPGLITWGLTALGVAALASGVAAEGQSLPGLPLKQAPGLGALIKQASDLTGRQGADDEAQSGEIMAAPVFGAAPPWRNDRVQAYVNLVGRNLARQVERKDVEWRFAVLDTASVNAMAFPGGIVVITRGLYERLESEDELAAVLAHEIAHVNRRHQWKVIQQQKLVALGEGALVRGDAARNTKVIADLGARLIARGLDKSAEFEADRDGMVIAARAGYDSSALIAVMERLRALAPGQADTAMLFSTHPSPDERIAAMTAAASPELEAAAEPSPAANRFRTRR